MNNEFEWRQQMRKHAEPIEPARDLWPAIAARLATAAVSHRRSWRSRIGWLAIAATLVVAGGAGLTAYRWQRAVRVPAPVPAMTATDVQAVAVQPVASSSASASELTALDW